MFNTKIIQILNIQGIERVENRNMIANCAFGMFKTKKGKKTK